MLRRINDDDDDDDDNDDDNDDGEGEDDGDDDDDDDDDEEEEDDDEAATQKLGLVRGSLKPLRPLPESGTWGMGSSWHHDTIPARDPKQCGGSGKIV